VAAAFAVRPGARVDLGARLDASRRPLVLGIGGGGDVVGALAVSGVCGGVPVIGGVTWERRPIDPVPGPRAAAEIADASPLAPGVLLAGPRTRVRGRDVRFAESRMAEVLGESTVLVDANRSPRELAAGLDAGARALGCDLVVFADVGGDVLGAGGEPGLASPLCDAVLLAAAVHLEQGRGRPAVGAVFGAGCDGELTLAEVRARLDLLDAAGALAGPRRIAARHLELVEAAVASVPTEASAMALRAARGERGQVAIRNGRRTVTLAPLAGETYFFDPIVAIRTTTPLAAAVLEAGDLEQANRLLGALGVRTELDYERAMAGPP
jgi:hypothetical protein